jgi:hypothetical protein
MNQDIVNLQTFIGYLDVFQNAPLTNQYTIEQKQNIAQQLMGDCTNIRNHYAGFCQLFDQFLDRMGVLEEWLQNNPPPPPPPPPHQTAPAAGGKRRTRRYKGGMNNPFRQPLKNITSASANPDPRVPRTNSGKTRTSNKSNQNNIRLTAPPQSTSRFFVPGYALPELAPELKKELQENPEFQGSQAFKSNNESSWESVSNNSSVERIRKARGQQAVKTNYKNTMKNAYYFFKPNTYNRSQASMNAMYARQLQGLRDLANKNKHYNINNHKNNTGYNANTE